MLFPRTLFTSNLKFSEALLHAHRKYVVQAIKLDHHDPLKTKYGPSITNAIRSARILLCALGSLAEKHTKHTSQISFFWASAFSALVRSLFGNQGIIFEN